MRPFVSTARNFLVSVMSAALIVSPAMAAAARPVGMVVIADKARLGSANAAAGANVFPGDYIDTAANGTLRLQVGAGQMYLLSSSAAEFVQEDERVIAHLQHGTMGFSTSAPATLAVQTPLGLVHGGDEKRVFAQVTILAPNKIQVSAYEGSVIVDGNDGRKQFIAAGQTYQGDLAADSGAGGTPVSAYHNGINWHEVVGAAIILGGLALVACELWPESNSSPGCF